MRNKKRYFAWLVVLALVISTVYVPGVRAKAAGIINIALENGASLYGTDGKTASYSANGKEVRLRIGKYTENPLSFEPVTITAPGGPLSAQIDTDNGEYAVYIEYAGEVNADLMINGAREANRASGSYTRLPNNFNGGTLNISVEIQNGNPNNNPQQGQEIFPGPGEIVFNMSGYNNAKIEYKVGEGNWTEAKVVSGSAIRLSNFTTQDTGKSVSVRVSGQELDDFVDQNTGKHRNRVIVQKNGSNDASEIDIYEVVKTDSGYNFIYDYDSTYRFYLEFRGGQGGGNPNFANSLEVWIGETCVVPYNITSADLGEIVFQSFDNRNTYKIYENNDYIVYGADDGEEVNDQKNINCINYVWIRPKSKTITLDAIRAYGTGTVEILASMPKEMMGEDMIDAHRKIDMTIKSVEDSSDPAFGYSFYGDTSRIGRNEPEGGLHQGAQIKFIITEGVIGRKDEGEDRGSTIALEGSLHLSYFYIRELQRVTIGTETAPVENCITLSYRGEVEYKDEMKEGESYVSAEISAPLTCYFTGAFMKGNDKNEKNIYQGFDFCRAQDDATVELHDLDGTTQMFDNPSGKMKLRVMTGGNFILSSDQKINVPATQAGYYSASGELVRFEMTGRMRMQDAVKLVNCVPGDHSKESGRYVYTESADGKNVVFRSTTATLWNCGVKKVENGFFLVEAGTGVLFVNPDRDDPNFYSYQFEEGTEIKFTLIPDPGYQYKPGTFQFMDGQLVEDSKYVKAVKDEPGAYIYTMEDHNLSVSCEFEPVTDDIQVTSDTIADASISMGNNALPGSMEFSVKEVNDASDTVTADIKATAGEDYDILSVLDLSLNQVINTVTGEDAWVTSVSTLNDPMDVSFKLGSAEDVEYEVIRIHGEEKDKLGATYDKATGTISFKTDKYSTYAIVEKGAKSSGNENQLPVWFPGQDNNQTGGSDTNNGGSGSSYNGGSSTGGSSTGTTTGTGTTSETGTSTTGTGSGTTSGSGAETGSGSGASSGSGSSTDDGKNDEGSVITKNEDGTETETTVVTNTDGSKTEKEVTTDEDGNVVGIREVTTTKKGTVTVKEETVDENGNITTVEGTYKKNGAGSSTCVTTNADGDIISTTNEKTTVTKEGKVTTTTTTVTTKNADGSSEKVKTVSDSKGNIKVTDTVKNADGSSVKTTTTVDKKGNLTYTETTKNADKTKTTVKGEVNADGTGLKTITTTDKDGNVLSKTEATIKTNSEGTVTEKATTVNADGSKETSKTITYTSGKVKVSGTLTDVDGSKVKLKETIKPGKKGSTKASVTATNTFGKGKEKKSTKIIINVSVSKKGKLTGNVIAIDAKGKERSYEIDTTLEELGMEGEDILDVISFMIENIIVSKT